MELGCIIIELDALPSAAVRSDVLAGVRPFGSILLAAGVVQVCEPSGFFEVEEDVWIRQAMGTVADEDGVVRDGEKVESGRLLYGRCNVISDERGRVIARVVEILPPVDSIKHVVVKGEAETT